MASMQENGAGANDFAVACQMDARHESETVENLSCREFQPTGSKIKSHGILRKCNMPSLPATTRQGWTGDFAVS
jgi:hypothetical protein